MPKFWYDWLVAWCVLVGGFGIVLAGGAFELTDGPVRIIIGLLHPGDYEPSDHLRFGIGIQGTLTLGLAILMYTILQASGRHAPDRRTWILARQQCRHGL